MDGSPTSIRYIQIVYSVLYSIFLAIFVLLFGPDFHSLCSVIKLFSAAVILVHFADYFERMNSFFHHFLHVYIPNIMVTQ